MKLEHFDSAVEWWDNRQEITLPHKTRAEKKFIHELETEWEEYCHERGGKNSETVD